MRISEKRVDEILRDCLFREDELIDWEPPENCVIGQGVLKSFGFHPDRLRAHESEIKEMLSQFSDEFYTNGGGGWTFLNLCYTKNGEHWGEHQSMEKLVALGNALGIVKFLLPRSMWTSLPGGMPYISIER